MQTQFDRKRKIDTAVALLLLTALSCFGQAQYSTTVLVSGQKAVTSGPAYVGEDNRWSETASGATTIITLAGSVASGGHVVVPVYWHSAAQTLSSVSDSRGNSYTIDTNRIVGIVNLAICSARVATALQATDTITLTWGSAAYTYRAGAVFSLSGVAASSYVDALANTNNYSTAISLNRPTTSANTVAFGVLTVEGVVQTYGSSNWDVIGTYQTTPAGTRLYYLKKVVPASGNAEPGGTLTGNETWTFSWAAYK